MIFDKGCSVYAIPGLKTQYQKNIEISDVIKIVSECLYIPVYEIMSRCRKKEIVTARHLIMYLCVYELSKSTAEIGRFFQMDHTSIIHACYNITNWMKNDENFLRTFRYVKTKIKEL